MRGRAGGDGPKVTTPGKRGGIIRRVDSYGSRGKTGSMGPGTPNATGPRLAAAAALLLLTSHPAPAAPAEVQV